MRYNISFFLRCIDEHVEFSRRLGAYTRKREKERALCHRKQNDQGGSTIGMQILRDGTRHGCVTLLNVF